MKRQWDNIDEWAETIGKHCVSSRPLSDRVKVLSAKDWDRQWARMVKEAKKTECVQL